MSPPKRARKSRSQPSPKRAPGVAPYLRPTFMKPRDEWYCVHGTGHGKDRHACDGCCDARKVSVLLRDVTLDRNFLQNELKKALEQLEAVRSLYRAQIDISLDRNKVVTGILAESTKDLRGMCYFPADKLRQIVIHVPDQLQNLNVDRP